MVVFDEQGVEESGSVVRSAATSDGVLGQPLPPGNGLSGVANDGRCSFDGLDEPSGLGGDAAKVAEIVEEGTFDDEQVEGSSRKGSDSGALLNPITVLALRFPTGVDIELLK